MQNKKLKSRRQLINFVFVLLYFIVFILFFTSTVFSQNNLPVKNLFFGNYLADAPSSNTLKKNDFNINIIHRFGKTKNMNKDLFGIYAPSNIMLGVDYGLTNKITLHTASEKNLRTQEFAIKLKTLSQSIGNNRLINITYLSKISYNAQNKSYFGLNYKLSDRLFYTNSLIISKQIKYKFFVSSSFNYFHFNKINKTFGNTKAMINLTTAYKFWLQKSIFLSYDYPISFKNNTFISSPNICFGVDIPAKVHQYQVFITNQEYINTANAVSFNSNKIALKNMRVAFNIIIKL